MQPWNFYFHWNQQETYWPLNSAGHHDLLNSYLNFRFNSLQHAKKDAKEIFKTDGAFVSDVCDRRGYNSASEFLNHTPVAQIAMDFWRQYCFTGNMDFLKNYALPYMLESAYFFESLFEKCRDGKYHAKEGTGYEGWIKLRDCISEITYAKTLFSSTIEALKEAGVKEPRAEKWKEIMDNLVPLPIINAGSDKIFAAGWGVEEKRILNSPIDGIFPWVEYSAVFPSGFVGLSQKGSELFKAAVNTAKLYAPAGTGWDPSPIVLARLGLGPETKRIIDTWPSQWQFYCNGFGHYGPMDPLKAESTLKFKTYLVRDASIPEKEREKSKFPFSTWPFRHMGMESMSVLACVMNESLLQSHEGIIRIAPATAEKQNARFTLHATGGFVVSAEIKNGKILWVFINSKLGKICRLENPWSKSYLYKNGKKSASLKEKNIEFPTVKNDKFMIVPDEKNMKNWKIVPIHYNRNENIKKSSCGNARLGLPRMF